MPKTKTQFIALTLLYGLFALSVIAVARVVLIGPTNGWGLRIDSLSSLFLLMVTFLGVVCGQYSVRYLDGEVRQDAYFRHLTFTIFAVAAMVTAANLITLFIAWLAISIGLHRLLLFYPIDQMPCGPPKEIFGQSTRRSVFVDRIRTDLQSIWNF